MRFKSIILLSISILLISGNLHSQEVMKRVPKQLSFEAGYRSLMSSDFENTSPNGYHLGFDYAWQLSGFGSNKSASYISVPLLYTVFPSSDGKLSHTMFSYGWTVRHEFGKEQNKPLPFTGYALLLNQYSIDGTEGSIFGHQTRFTFGYNFYKADRKLTPFAKIEYSLNRFPQFGNKKSWRVHFWEVKVGFRFERASK